MSDLELAQVCDAFDNGELEINIMPELIELDYEKRPAAYADMKELLKPKVVSDNKKRRGMNEIAL